MTEKTWQTYLLPSVVTFTGLKIFCAIEYVVPFFGTHRYFSTPKTQKNVTSRVVSIPDGGGGLKTLCIKKGYSEPTRAEKGLQR